MKNKEWIICPILSIAKHASDYIGTNNTLVRCQEEECAWWNKISEGCIVHALSCLAE